MNKFILPEKWYILKKDLPTSCWQIVVDYFNSGCNTGDYTCSSSGFFYPNFISYKGFENGGHSGSITDLSPYNKYTEITYDIFLKYVLQQEPDIQDIEYNQILIKLLTE